MVQLKGGHYSNANISGVADNAQLIESQELRIMIQNAYHQGKNYADEQIGLLKKQLAEEQKRKLEETELFWKCKLAEQKEVAVAELEAFKSVYKPKGEVSGNENILMALEQNKKCERNDGELFDEKDCLKLQISEREERLTSEFNHTVEEVEARIMPLQQSPLCKENRRDVLECYKRHKEQPLKCSRQVKEFVQCVQCVRLKLMKKTSMEKTES